ncbi:hypothetical protein ACHAWF_016155 [Thalassiosira exigua]
MRTLHEREGTAGVELMPFIWEDESTYEAALKGVKTVFVTLPVTPKNWDVHFPKFLKACTANHVRRIVELSFYHSIRPKAEHASKHYGDPEAYVASHDGFHEVELVHKMALCDGDLILHKELEVALLHASHLMSNFFRCGVQRKALKESSQFYGASGSKGANYVSPNDVADVAAKAIFDKNRAHKRQTHTLTGPAAVTNEELASLLSESLGTKISYVEKPLTFFDKDTAAFERIKATGIEEGFAKGDFKKAMGREAESFKDYLKAVDRMSPIELELFKDVPAKDEEEVVEDVFPDIHVEEKEEEPSEEVEPTAPEEDETDSIEPTGDEVEVVEKSHVNAAHPPMVEAQ